MIEIAILQLINTKGVGNAAIRRLADIVQHEGVLPSEVISNDVSGLASTLNVKGEVAESIINSYESACIQAEELYQHDIDLTWVGGKDYPERVRTILGKDAPSVFFMRGNRKLLDESAVGFCGSRKASEKGIEVTEIASRILAENSICVVSGYAHGVDLAAHRSAIEAGGSTIFVLVDGILRFRAKRKIRDYLTCENHLVLSQFPPKLTWIGRNAMKRNATIIGLSDVMILVEAESTGGTYAAGTETLKRNHPLFVVEFAEPVPSAEANPYFLEHGGIPIRGNRERIPNMETVMEVAKSHAWKNRNETTLF